MNHLGHTGRGMSAKQIFQLCLFFSALAVPYILWLASSVEKPLWEDESITVALVQSVTLKHMLSGVLLGLDATPPLYTGFGWFMLHYVVPGASPELLLRLTNAGLIGATLWILYLLIRRYFDRTTSLMTIAVFILLELQQLKFLTLEMRSYSVLVFCTTLAIYVALRAIAQPSWMSLIWTMLACCLLVSAHTFGVIYVVSIVSCMMVAAISEGNLRLALCSGLTGVPAVILFVSWLPVLHTVTKMGNYISRPPFRWLAGALGGVIYANALSVSQTRLLPALVLITVLVLLFRKNPRLIQWWQSATGVQLFVIAIPVSFGVNTSAVWIFSRLVFPVFATKYFAPNIILHTIWLSCLVDIVFSYVKSPKAKYGLVLGAAVLAGLFIKFGQFSPEFRIPCFDPYRRTYLEDAFVGNGVIVALSDNTWVTRLNRKGEVIVYPSDGSLKTKDILDRQYTATYLWEEHYVLRMAKWAGVKSGMTTSQLLDTYPSFMVLDDHYLGNGNPWLVYIQQRYRVKLTSLAETKGCTVWLVEVNK